MTLKFTGVAKTESEKEEYDRLWNEFLMNGQRALDKPVHTEEPRIGFQA